MNPDPERAGSPADGTRPLWGPVRLPGAGADQAPAPPTVIGPTVVGPAVAPPLVPAPRNPVEPTGPRFRPAPAWPAPPGPPPAAPRPAAPPPAAPGASRRPLIIAAAVAAAVAVASVSAVVVSERTAPQTAVNVQAPPVTAEAALRPTPPAPAPTTRSTLASPSGTVSVLDPAAAHPAAETVLALVDRHFTAINDRDYDAWTSTVVERRARDQPRSRWTADYRSTRDSAVRITAIEETGPDSVVVSVSFVSEQDPADAPPDLPVERICWKSRWPVVDLADGGRLDRPASGTTTRSAC